MTAIEISNSLLLLNGLELIDTETSRNSIIVGGKGDYSLMLREMEIHCFVLAPLYSWKSSV